MQTIKLVVVGPSGVGKTSLRGQYISNRFASSYRATIGADFIAKNVTLQSGDTVNLQIWDTAGQERFSSLSTAFLRGADAAIVVFDVTAPLPSLAEQSDVRKWMDIVRDGVNLPRFGETDEDDRGFCWAIVANKMDQLLDEEVEERRDAVLGMLDGMLGIHQNEVDACTHREEDMEEDMVSSVSTIRTDNTTSSVSTIRPSPAPWHINGVVEDATKSKTDTIPIQSLSSSKHSRSKSTSRISSRFQLSLPEASNSSNASHHPHLSSRAQPLSKSTSSMLSFHGGTMTTTRTTLTIYHTPSSSFSSHEGIASDEDWSEGWASARESPVHWRSSTRSRSKSLSRLSTRDTENQVVEGTSNDTPKFTASRSISDETITPSTLRDPSALTSSEVSQPITCPHCSAAGPIFFASAKTGTNVRDIFDYVARRVVDRDKREERMMSFLDDRQQDSDGVRRILTDIASGRRAPRSRTVGESLHASARSIVGGGVVRLGELVRGDQTRTSGGCC